MKQITVTQQQNGRQFTLTITDAFDGSGIVQLSRSEAIGLNVQLTNALANTSDPATPDDDEDTPSSASAGAADTPHNNDRDQLARVIAATRSELHRNTSMTGDRFNEVLAAHDAAVTRQAREEILRRADDGIEFGPENYARLVRLVREVAPADTLGDDPDCTCGYGGFHEPENPRCERNQR